MQEFAKQRPRESQNGTVEGSFEAFCMPTCAELNAAGRGDLVLAIRAAGGSLVVAQVVQHHMSASGGHY